MKEQRSIFRRFFYDVEGFLSGSTSLKSIELSELGAVGRKHLLHLQCHFGLDTLSWARKSAVVRGVDFSPLAIKRANEIRRKSGLQAESICADVYSYGETVKPVLDIVFTSYGSICWLPDINLWASTIGKSLKPGGTFYMADFHPFFFLLAGYTYFQNPEPDIEDGEIYTENSHSKKATLINWSHPLSNVINALIKTGIRIEAVNEYPYSPYNCFEDLLEKEKGRYYCTKFGQNVPLVYSIKGTKVDH